MDKNLYTIYNDHPVFAFTTISLFLSAPLLSNAWLIIAATETAARLEGWQILYQNIYNLLL